jgi:3-hydroxyisobutyrate dehydrogenase
MAACLVRAGQAPLLLDARPEVAPRFAREVGGTAAADLASLAGASEVIITMLPTSDAVAAVLDGTPEAPGLLAGLRPEAILLEMSSGAPAKTRQLAELVAARGGWLVDAPVSGGVARAETGTLAIMAGGAAAAIDRAEPVLRAMGSSVTRTGAVGSAHAMKALNNLVSAGGFLIGIEALLIGQRFGLAPGMMTDVLNASTGMNNATQKKFRQFVLSRRFDSGFSLDLMVKDLSIALDVARESGAAAPFAALCRELWASAAASLGPGQDHTAMARLSEQLAGTVLEAEP